MCKLNIIVAITNFTCIFPIYISIKNKDNITVFALIFVSFFSIISHLLENHKHGMTGIFDTSKEISYILNRLDVLGSIIIILRLAKLYYNKYNISANIIKSNSVKFILMLLPILFNIISEYDKYNIKLRLFYVITHSIWHLYVFSSIYYFLNHFIYAI